TRTGKERAVLKLDQPITSWSAARFSPDGKLLAILDHGADKQVLSTWDAVSGKKIRQATVKGFHFALAISPDGNVLATSGDEDVILIDTANLNEVARLPLPSPEAVSSLSFSPDGRLLAGSRQHADLILWNVDERKVKCRIPALRMDRLAFSPDGKMLAAWGMSGEGIQLWEVAAATPKRVLARPGHGHYVDVLAVSPQRKLAASGALHDASLRMWDALARAAVRELRTADDWVSACAFSADGRVVVSGGYNGTIHLWETATGKQLHKFVFENPPNVRGPGMMIAVQVHLSPDGKRLTAFC